MAKNIRSYQAQQTPTVVPGARAQPGAMAQSETAALGQDITSRTLNWQTERDNAEIAKQTSALNNYQFTLMRELEDDYRSGKFTNADQFAQAEADYAKARESFISKSVKGKSRRIAERVQQYADANQEIDSRQFYNSLFAKEKEFRTVEALQTIEQYKTRGERDKALMAIEQNKYWLGPIQAKRMRDTLDADIAVYEHQAFLDQIWDGVKEMPYETAMHFLNDIKGISEPERNALKTRRDDQQRYEIASTDKRVYLDTWRKVIQEPHNVTDDDLDFLIGPGSLTPDDVIVLTKLRDAPDDDPLKSPQAQTYFGILDAMYPDITKPDKKDITFDRLEEYDRKYKQLENHFKTNPKASSKERRDFFEELVKPEVKSFWERLFGGAMVPPGRQTYGRFGGGGGPVTPKSETEPKTQGEFEDTVINMMQNNASEDEINTYYDKWKDKW